MEEETLSGQNTEKLPPNRTQCPRPQITTTNKKKNKRKRSDVDIHNSAYFKIRALVLQVRPYFVEALQTPDFCNCKAAYEIRKRMKLMMDFYKQMQIEGNPKDEQENSTKWQPLFSETKHDKEHFDGLCMKKSPEKLSKGRWPHGSYIVGGSVSGCNFITLVNRKPPVYYGVTKESYRRSCCRSEKGSLRLGANS
ncbi:uncharacterized protein LOC130758570 isoform X1 [Actinidia eriantha]|uniref:uncharacterized protein LOC130758570 isoform X1 n=1 Tax=Actinidia eriantha TaxID=165200 RepID=UPI0025836471|nr:uncharacterized protein LOC130758570 isoform X1 [Actinidia eriantha]